MAILVALIESDIHIPGVREYFPREPSVTLWGAALLSPARLLPCREPVGPEIDQLPWASRRAPQGSGRERPVRFCRCGAAIVGTRHGKTLCTLLERMSRRCGRTVVFRRQYLRVTPAPVPCVHDGAAMDRFIHDALWIDIESYNMRDDRRP